MTNDTKLNNFNGLEIELEYDEILEKYSKECVNYIKQLSPKGKSKKHYADGWRYELKKYSKCKSESIVYNKNSWQLTHLLENGHLITNKRNGVGWASPHLHIQTAYEKVKSPFLRALEKDLKIKIEQK